ncbi:MAG: GHKL domain-containing protein [Lachnospiraceae bacterium]|nr:GHKL domain-containing protein [Lachnospiraceae bacterium]
MLQIIIPDFLELVIIYIVVSFLLGLSLKDSVKRTYLMIPFCGASSFIESNSSFHLFIAFCLCLIELLFILFLFKKSIVDSIVIYSLCYFIVTVIQTILIFFISHVPNLLTNPYLPILENLLTITISFILGLFLKKYKCYSLIENNFTLKALSASLFSISFFINCFYKMDIQAYFGILIYIVSALIVLSLINWEVFSNQKRLAEKEKELHAYETYLPIINELIDQVRIRQHQYDNHIQAIRMLPVTCTDYDALVSKLAEYSDYIADGFSDTTLLKMNNKVLAGFLFSKYCEAIHKNRNLQIQLKKIDIQTSVPEHDLVTILGILIDNALEAIEENDVIFLVLNSQDNRCQIRISNKCQILNETIQNNMFNKGYTTKPNSDKKHGLGLYNLKKLVDEYHGKIIVSNEALDEANYLVFEIDV